MKNKYSIFRRRQIQGQNLLQLIEYADTKKDAKKASSRITKSLCPKYRRGTLSADITDFCFSALT